MEHQEIGGSHAIQILVVEDRPLARKLLESELSTASDLHICGEARDGTEAVEKVKQLDPDIVIMDIVMPRMDGLTATAKIRTFSDVPIVILTGSHTDSDTLRFLAKKRGADAFLLKPSGPVSPDLYKIKKELVGEIRRLTKV